VGLVAREIEAAGISTIVLSNIAEFTASVGTPRIASIPFPGSQPLGPAGDEITHLAVLSATLEALETISHPGTIIDLPFSWPRGVPKALKAPVHPPIARLIMKRPWLLPKFISGDIPKS